jgi:hypothetical protein
MYRPGNVEQRNVKQERDVVYVQQPVQERYVYVEPVPAYRVITPDPAYSSVTSRPASVTRYYYYTE